MRRKILIVDDHAELRKLVRMALAPGDYEFLEAASGQEAIAAADTFHPDLVILDVMMPGALDGFDVCRTLRASALLNSIKILMLTARGQKEDCAIGTQAGADGYIVKPFSPLALSEIVNSTFADEVDSSRSPGAA